MNKVDREKFMSIEVNDTVWYLDANGSRCQGIVSGWKNLAGDAAPLLGPRGEHHIPLGRVLSRVRHGNIKEWG